MYHNSKGSNREAGPVARFIQAKHYHTLPLQTQLQLDPNNPHPLRVPGTGTGEGTTKQLLPKLTLQSYN